LAAGEANEKEFGQETDADADDDDESFRGVQEKESRAHLAPKWPTRVFAVSCMMKIMQVSE